MDHPGYWLAKTGYHGSKLNLFEKLTGIDLGHVLFERLSQVDGPIMGRPYDTVVPTFAPLKYEELGPIKDVVDFHYSAVSPKLALQSIPEKDIDVLHLRGLPDDQASVRRAINDLANKKPGSAVLVGSERAGPLIETVIKADREKRLHGMVLNGASAQRNDRVLYVRDIYDPMSAASMTPDHDVIEYYKQS